MLFAVFYEPRHTDEETEQRRIQLFATWSPPAGIELKAHYALATGGGIVICEASDGMAVFEGLAPWNVFNEYRVEPIIEIEAAKPVWERMLQWRASVR
jgi:hypothetical protein